MNEKDITLALQDSKDNLLWTILPINPDILQKMKAPKTSRNPDQIRFPIPHETLHAFFLKTQTPFFPSLHQNIWRHSFVWRSYGKSRKIIAHLTQVSSTYAWEYLQSHIQKEIEHPIEAVILIEYKRPQTLFSLLLFKNSKQIFSSPPHSLDVFLNTVESPFLS